MFSSTVPRRGRRARPRPISSSGNSANTERRWAKPKPKSCSASPSSYKSSSANRLERRGLAIASWITGRKISVIEAPDRLAAAELVVVVHGNQVVPALPELVERRPREAVLATDLGSLYPPEPGAVTSRLRILAVVGDAHDYLHMALRLHRAAHHSEAHHRGAVFGDKARNDRVVRTLVGPDPVRMA